MLLTNEVREELITIHQKCEKNKKQIPIRINEIDYYVFRITYHGINLVKQDAIYANLQNDQLMGRIVFAKDSDYYEVIDNDENEILIQQIIEAYKDEAKHIFAHIVKVGKKLEYKIVKDTFEEKK